MSDVRFCQNLFKPVSLCSLRQTFLFFLKYSNFILMFICMFYAFSDPRVVTQEQLKSVKHVVVSFCDSVCLGGNMKHQTSQMNIEEWD